MKPKFIHLIRHGQVEEAYQGKFVGRIDADLSQEGKKQMKRLTDYLNQLEDPKYIISPLKRAQDSFKWAVDIANKSPIIDDDFKEIHFGNWQGLTFNQIRTRYPDLYKEWKTWSDRFQYPQGESYAHFIRRIKKCIRLIRSLPNQNIVVFSHGGVIRFLICALLGMDPSYHNSFKIDRGSVTRIDMSRRVCVLTDLNRFNA